MNNILILQLVICLQLVLAGAVPLVIRRGDVASNLPVLLIVTGVLCGAASTIEAAGVA